MMTPFGNKAVLSHLQKEYQRAQLKGRNPVERTIGIFKSRFRCLDHKSRGAMQFTPEKCAVIIACCTILHNYCRRRNIIIDILPHIQEELDADRVALASDTPAAAADNTADTIAAGNRARKELIIQYFS